MHPFKFIQAQPITTAGKPSSPQGIDETVAQFLTVSAHFMNLPAERIKQLTQHKSNLTNNL